MKSKDQFLIITLLIILTIMFLSYETSNPAPKINLLQLENYSDYYKSIILGGEWFINNQYKSFLYYEYDYQKKQHSSKSHSLREMGALWSISKLSHFLADERYDVLAKRGIKYFEKYFKYDSDNDFYYVDITPQKIKLGYSAFIILTLLEIDHPEKEEYLRKFANGILFMQNPSGELRTFFYSDRDTGKDYYPGEALVALISLYEYTNDESYLNAVNKAFPFYVEYFRSNPNTAFVPWQSRAYHKLYKLTQNKEVADFIFEMNDFMLSKNNPNGCEQFDFARGITTAVFLEGVIAAYDIAEELGDFERSNCYRNFIEQGSDHILPLQITSNSDSFALGGFLGSQSSSTMRVDRNQHAVMALMDAHSLGILE